MNGLSGYESTVIIKANGNNISHRIIYISPFLKWKVVAVAEQEPEASAHTVHFNLLILRIPPHHEVRSAVACSMEYLIPLRRDRFPFLSRSERIKVNEMAELHESPPVRLDTFSAAGLFLLQIIHGINLRLSFL